VKNRIHLDLVPASGTRDEEPARLLGLGAMVVDDLRRPEGPGWVVLADPEGNELCILRSEAERTASAAAGRWTTGTARDAIRFVEFVPLDGFTSSMSDNALPDGVRPNPAAVTPTVPRRSMTNSRGSGCTTSCGKARSARFAPYGSDSPMVCLSESPLEHPRWLLSNRRARRTALPLVDRLPAVGAA